MVKMGGRGDMIKASSSLQDLRRRIYAKAKAEPSWRFWSLSRCFGYIRDWVEKKLWRHLLRSRKRRGFGWKRWSRQWLYENLGLFKGYRIRRSQLRPKALPA